MSTCLGADSRWISRHPSRRTFLNCCIFCEDLRVCPHRVPGSYLQFRLCHFNLGSWNCGHVVSESKTWSRSKISIAVLVVTSCRLVGLFGRDVLQSTQPRRKCVPTWEPVVLYVGFIDSVKLKSRRTALLTWYSCQISWKPFHFAEMLLVGHTERMNPCLYCLL